MQNYIKQVQEAATMIQGRLSLSPKIGIILGTGLGDLAKEISVENEVSYTEIPHFPHSTVESHAGKLLCGKLCGVEVLALQGRFHLYEGYSAHQITFPIRVLKSLGIEKLLISNAAGGMNPLMQRGDVMLIQDHINLQGKNPLIGENVEAWGARFPDMSAPYCKTLQKLALKVAVSNQIALQKGVYLAVEGPNLETRAEYRFLRKVGADVVGMSTVPEVIVANHAGMKVAAFSVITDECFPESLKPVSIPEILAAAAEAEPKLTTIIKGMVVEM